MNQTVSRFVEAVRAARAILIIAAILTISVVLLGPPAQRAFGAVWEPFAVEEGNGAQWCYDKQSVEVSGNVADAWVLIAEKDGAHSFAELRIWCDISCYTIMAGQQYNKGDEILLEFREEKENWKSIGDGTCIEELSKAICPKMPLPRSL
jgi:hypothetical protein